MSSDGASSPSTPPPRVVVKRRGRPDLTENQRKSVISILLDDSEMKEGKRVLARGAVARVAKKFDVHRSTVLRIWARAETNRGDPEVEAYRSTPQKKGNTGIQQKWDRESMVEALIDIPRHKRKNIRGLAGALGMPYSTVHAILKNEDVIVAHTSAIKPTLTDKNKVDRLLYAADRVDLTGPPYAQLYFQDSFDEIHLDEKWFFLTQESQRVYLARGEAPPERKTKHKNHILKVMFLAAVARPRFNDRGECTFDGKIGIWPFVTKVRAQRSSAN
jgi:transposase-like protein